MLIKRPNDILSSEITAESVYLQRRELLRAAGIAAVGALTSQSVFAITSSDAATGKELAGVRESPFSTDRAPN
ncbi:MAG: mononuclear molybdenum enzyme YedY, partial [Xanthomonadales bacterium]|nr:mononuclear molybdenum enzyme YedY [Gammaproteobacteria bacterium]NNK03224.1 mononuclear molybdenum enzyme YedY [Xanthomonadales bacterium]